MTLDAFRAALLAQARQTARQQIDEAERDARERVRDARQRAVRVLDDAREQGRQAAEHETRRLRAQARQEGREARLRTRRDTLAELRRRTLARLEEQRDTPAYQDLLDRLERLAREQLGSDAEVDTEPDEGGLVARAGGRRVDYRLPAVVDRALQDMGDELEELWR
jgi:vacuolar-type H+-ATPase subunit E/Vma4